MQKLDHFHRAVQCRDAPFSLNIYTAQENALFLLKQESTNLEGSFLCTD